MLMLILRFTEFLISSWLGIGAGRLLRILDSQRSFRESYHMKKD